MPELPAIRIGGEWTPWAAEAESAAQRANEQLSVMYAAAAAEFERRQDEDDAITALLLVA